MKKSLGSLRDFLINSTRKARDLGRICPEDWGLSRSLLLFLLLFLNTLNASPLCDYNFKVSNENPFVKEGVEITFYASQKDKSSVMFYELTPPKNAEFELHFLKKEEDKSTYHDKKVRYSYLLYPLKEGKLSLKFDFKVSQASDKSMEVFASGNRDVIKPMMTDETTISLEPLNFKVKPIKSSQLLGDYHLDMTSDTKEIDTYEQVNVTYTIKGDGYPSQLEHLLPEIEGVEQFLEVKKMKNGTQVFHYAFSAKKDFTVPATQLNCFSPKKNSHYILKSEAIMIKVKEHSVKDILDKEDSLPDTAFNGDTLLPYLNGLLLFLAGYFVANFKLLQYFSKKKTNQNPLHQKIKDAKDEKALLKLLLGANLTSFAPHISTLEDVLYHDRKVSLKEIKDALLTV